MTSGLRELLKRANEGCTEGFQSQITSNTIIPAFCIVPCPDNGKVYEREPGTNTFRCQNKEDEALEFKNASCCMIEHGGCGLHCKSLAQSRRRSPRDSVDRELKHQRVQRT